MPENEASEPETTEKSLAESTVDQVFEACRANLEEFETTEVRCAITGRSGSGKSSLINAIAGERIAAVNVVETTKEKQEYKHAGIIFTDLPGCGTPNWPRETYIERLDFESFDCFLLVTDTRFTEDDLYLYRELLKREKPCFVIRNKIDLAISNGKFDNDYDAETVRRVITENLVENLAPDYPSDIYLVSAHEPAQHDLAELLDEIESSLPDIKSQRFLLDSAALSAKKLDEKRALLEKRLLWYCGVAAANGAIPIPFVDIGGDLAVMIKFADETARGFGIREEQLGHQQRFLRSRTGQVVMGKAAQFTASFLTKQGMKILLQQNAKKAVGKQLGKLVPVLGSAIGATVGGSGTWLVGRQMIKSAESIAREVLDEMTTAMEEDR